MLFLILVTIIVGYLSYVAIKPLSFWKKKGIIYETGYPFFGNMWPAVLRKKHLIDIQKDIYNKYPNNSYVGIQQFNKPMLMIRNIDLIKKITIKDFDHFTDHTGFVDEDPDPIMSRSLFVMKGEVWRQMRATLSPAFTSAKMKNMFQFMVECAENVVKMIPTQEGIIEFNMRDLISKFTNDVIASTYFGILCNSIEEPNNTFYQMAKKFTTFTAIQNLKIMVLNIFPFIYKWFNLRIFPQEQVKFFSDIVHKTMAKREAENIIRPDTLHLLMEAKKGKLHHENKVKDEDVGFATVQESDIGKSENIKTVWSDDDILAQALIFFFAGFETSASASTFIAYELAVNSDIQEKLHDEIDSILENGKLTYDNLLNMKYLDQVIAETMRKWAIGFQTDRLCTQDYVIEPITPEDKRVVIEKGVTCVIPTISIHHDPNYWPEPEKFDPERFNDQNKNDIIPGSYLPFGVGPRNCIGSRFALLEIKVLYVNLLAKFDIVPVKKSIIPYKLSTKKLNMVPDDLILGFKPRKVTSL